MNKGFEYTFFLEDIQMASPWKDIQNCQENANKNHNEISLYSQ